MKKVLGRGLEALISQDLRESISETERIKELDVDKIDPNPRQPRVRFNEARLVELAESIKRHGVLQPIVVRRSGERYTLILGERRLRAAKIAGRTTVPAIVREIGDSDSLKQALMENLQREDLNPLEEASGYDVLRTEFGLSPKEIAEIIGKDRSTVSNALRLLALPDEIKQYISEGKLTAGHARALLAIEGEAEQIEWARKIMLENLSVRDMERAVAPRGGVRRKKARISLPPQLRAIEEALELHLGTRVRLSPRGRGGVIGIEYYSQEELEGILEKLGIEIPM